MNLSNLPRPTGENDTPDLLRQDNVPEPSIVPPADPLSLGPAHPSARHHDLEALA